MGDRRGSDSGAFKGAGSGRDPRAVASKGTTRPTACPRGARPGSVNSRDRREARKGGAVSKAAHGGKGASGARGKRRAGEGSGLKGHGGARNLFSRLSPRVVILALLFVFFVTFAFGPAMRNLEATSRLKRKEEQLRAERRTTRRLEEEVERARSTGYIEEEAREQRMVYPGEVLYLVTGEGEGQEVRYRVKQLQSMEEAWKRVKDKLNSGDRPPG